MNKYAQAALDAVKVFHKGNHNPVQAWEEATNRIFGAGTAAQKKGCPKDTFLGLCQEGRIQGIPRGEYTRSEKNRQYAIRAVEILANNPSLAENPLKLWKKVVQSDKSYNNQMDVVIVLWESKLIV